MGNELVQGEVDRLLGRANKIIASLPNVRDGAGFNLDVLREWMTRSNQLGGQHS